MYNTNTQIRFKTSMLRSSLCDYSDAYILIKGTVTIANTATKKVVFKTFAPFSSCISRINNKQIDDNQYIIFLVETVLFYSELC